MEITAEEESKFKGSLALKGEDLKWRGFRGNMSTAFKYMIELHVGNRLDLFRVSPVGGIMHSDWKLQRR